MKVIINNNIYNTKPVIVSKDISEGMMDKKFNQDYDSMLFLMTEGENTFWMKNCVTNLDILFINRDLITKIHHNCKPCINEECEKYRGYGDLVLELPGGDCKKFNIHTGDQIKLI
jgi:uncharacterized membrane protein (UPF0127 family)